MSIKDEIEAYSKAKVSVATGEIEDYDDAVFPNVIRKREINLIKSELEAAKPKLILDYGCGGGWLSVLLYRWGFNVVGMDVTANLLRKAKLACPEADFIVSDAEKLPFRDAVFDCIMGISILHHLNLEQGCNEIGRVSLNKSKFLFMEPNLLNPLSAFGRRFFPMETHTKGEKGFTPRYLRTTFKLAGFTVERYLILFFLAFPVARLFKIARIKPPSSLVKMISLFENVMEKMPGMRHLNSTIVAIGTTSR